jgi:hypothetical protein
MNSPVKVRPILFSVPMVRAMLAGRKSQTRRAMKPQPTEDFRVLAVEWYSPEVKDRHGEYQPGPDIFGVYGDEEGYKCPYGAPGDRLWVREKWWVVEREGRGIGQQFLLYDDEWEGGEPMRSAPLRPIQGYRWGPRPSIHMPRGFHRLELEITGVRVEQLQAITYEDALAEGAMDGASICDPEPNRHTGETPEQTARRLQWPQRDYRAIWTRINGKDSWDTNPWVWVIEFKTTPPQSGVQR